MKRLFCFIPILIFTFSVIAQPPEGPANKGMTFGEKMSGDRAVNANKLSSLLADTNSLEVKVKGKVKEVCKAEGCWIKMETENGLMMVKMKNHSFMVPIALIGKTIIAKGIATIKDTSVEMLRHYAEDAGKTKEEIAKIKEPKKEIIIQATGILVL